MNKDVYKPIFFKLNIPEEKVQYELLLKSNPSIQVYDEIQGQLKELIKILNPSIKIKPEDYPDLINKHVGDQSLLEYGVWVYYPWNNNIVHLLDEEEFIEVRTNRNKYKITQAEQEILRTKKIGIVGLSVGQSIALTLAMERTCGELRLADFDDAELSNLNRIRTGIHNLGVKKTTIAAREIAELDPFLNIITYDDGLHENNFDAFFTGDGKIDLLVEVCDGLDIKIESRFKARALGIPVVMDTNDRGMLDVERFDLEPKRAILHGLAGNLNPDNIKNLSNEEKIPYILEMIGIESLSTRLKASMIEVEQSINTWPQLASSVILGGALTTDVCRRILLDQFHDSGRYYVDFESLIKDEKKLIEISSQNPNPYAPLEKSHTKKIIDLYFSKENKAKYTLSQNQLDTIVDAAIAAPSAGNNQPWKWVFNDNTLFLFHDKFRSFSWGDYDEMGAYISLGTALENIHLQSASIGLEDNVMLFPIKEAPELIASITFDNLNEKTNKRDEELAKNIFSRHTNRKLSKRQILPLSYFKELQDLIDPKSEVKIFYTDTEENIIELSEIIAECDKIRLLNKLGHEEFYNEIKWTKQDAEKTRDGIELSSVELTPSEIAGFKVSRDWKALEVLEQLDKGNALKKMSIKSVQSSSGMLLVTVPAFTRSNLIIAGKTIQKIWLYSNGKKVSIHPMLSPIFFFNRLIQGRGKELSASTTNKLYNLRTRFNHVYPEAMKKQTEVFLMKLSIADDDLTRTLRKNKHEVFYAS